MLRRLKGVVVGFVMLMGLVLLASGVMAAQDIKTNYMPGTDFTKYKTYKWVTVEGAEKPNQILDQQIMQAVDTQLTTRGMTKVAGDPADMYVTYQVSITHQTEWNAYTTGGRRWGGGMGTATSTTIQIGTLDLDFYDAAAQKQIWQGQATKTLNPSKDPEKNLERLNKAVAKLLKNFPPKSGK